MVTHCRIAVFSDALQEMEQLEALGAVKVNPSLPFYDLNDTQPHFDEILGLLEGNERARVTIFWLTFSEKERSQARYLQVRSAWAGLESFFFHPECYERLHYYDTPYWQGHKLNDRYEHLRQIGPAMTKKLPDWRPARQFCSDYYSAMLNLYCSDHAKSVILEAGLTGAEFRPVLSEKTREPVPDLWQLWPTECEDFLAPGPFMETRKCRVCGKTRYFTSGGRARLRIREELVPEGLDFLQVPGAVGADIGYPFIILSHRAYCVLKEAGITRALVFEPLSPAE